MVDLNELARKKDLFIDNAAAASQNVTLVDDEVTREAIELNVIAPLIVEISERDQHIAALEAQLAERVKVKLLEWVRDDDAGCFHAETEFGEFIAWDNGRVQYGSFGSSFVDGGSAGAKSKAQADYERRILSALEATPPAPKVTDLEAALVVIQEKYDLRRSTLLSAITAALSGDAS